MVRKYLPNDRESFDYEWNYYIKNESKDKDRI